MEQQAPKQKRGFAALSPERRRELAKKGGLSVPGEKRAFSVNRDLAALAGRKGGEANSNAPKLWRKVR